MAKSDRHPQPVPVSPVAGDARPHQADDRVTTNADGNESQATLVADLHARDAVAHALGIEVCDVGPGRAAATMETTASMINGYGVVHGGYLFLLADTAFAMACATPRGPAVSRQAEITFVAPARAGDRLHAVAIERTSYGRSGIYDVTVSDANGVVYAEMRGHSQVVPRGFPTPRPDGPASTERGAVTAQ